MTDWAAGDVLAEVDQNGIRMVMDGDPPFDPPTAVGRVFARDPELRAEDHNYAGRPDSTAELRLPSPDIDDDELYEASIWAASGPQPAVLIADAEALPWSETHLDRLRPSLDLVWADRPAAPDDLIAFLEEAFRRAVAALAGLADEDDFVPAAHWREEGRERLLEHLSHEVEALVGGADTEEVWMGFNGLSATEAIAELVATGMMTKLRAVGAFLVDSPSRYEDELTAAERSFLPSSAEHQTPTRLKRRSPRLPPTRAAITRSGSSSDPTSQARASSASSTRGNTSPAPPRRSTRSRTASTASGCGPSTLPETLTPLPRGTASRSSVRANTRLDRKNFYSALR